MEAVTVFCFLLCCVATGRSEDFNLLILHNNDMHARFEETESNSGTCMDKHRNKTCIGGFARTAHEVRKHRQQAKDGTGPPVLFLNAGDTFTGTTWFSVFTYNISAEFVNMLAPDVVSLGNHEFDNGVAGLVPFVNGLNCPVLAANLDFSQEPSLSKIKPSTILEVSGKKIGVIGYLTTDTKHISTPGKTIFLDEIESVRNEAVKLHNAGINIIIALGHAGFLVDKEIAKHVPHVDVVVGGHTNTFLWNGAQPDLEHIDGPYPTVVTQSSGKKVPVVQAFAYTKYLGRLNLTFNDQGDLTNFYGQPELLVGGIPQDDDIVKALEVYRPRILEINKEVVGYSKVVLDGNTAKCRKEECVFGNLIADALVYYVASVSPERWTDTPIALVNGGVIRNTIDPTDTGGKVTRGELLGAIPFGNQVITLTLRGSDLVKTLEQGVRSNGETSRGEFLQVSGLKVVVDWSRPVGSRIVSVRVRCGPCTIPQYSELVSENYYRLATFSFLTNGGDGHTILKTKGLKYKTEDLSDVDTVVWYFNKYSPLSPKIEGRIVTSGVMSVTVGGTILVIPLMSMLSYKIVQL